MASRTRRRTAAFALGAVVGSGCGTLTPVDDAPAPDAAAAEAGPLGNPVSCADLRARDAGTPSGRYAIDPDGPGGQPAILVYCEMTMAGGGWTLVARSSVDASTFGWTSPIGSVSDVSLPYALDAHDAGLAFTEVMVADRKPYEYEPSAHAYRFSVPANFIEAYSNAPYDTAVTTVLGDCTVDGGPATLQHVGYTSLPDHFFFGDNRGGDTTTGLGPAVFRLAGSDCETGASLDQSQGLIFVR